LRFSTNWSLRWFDHLLVYYINLYALDLDGYHMYSYISTIHSTFPHRLHFFYFWSFLCIGLFLIYSFLSWTGVLRITYIPLARLLKLPSHTETFIHTIFWHYFSLYIFHSDETTLKPDHFMIHFNTILQAFLHSLYLCK